MIKWSLYLPDSIDALFCSPNDNNTNSDNGFVLFFLREFFATKLRL